MPQDTLLFCNDITNLAVHQEGMRLFSTSHCWGGGVSKFEWWQLDLKKSGRYIEKEQIYHMSGLDQILDNLAAINFLPIVFEFFRGLKASNVSS